MREIVGALDEAIHATIHDYVDPRTGHRGAVALAPRLGMQPGTLSNKANPLQEGHQLSLRESIPVQLLTGDFRILEQLAMSLDHVAVRLPEERGGGDLELLDQYAELHASIGKKAESIRRALSDGRVTAAEIEDVRKRLDAVIRAGLRVLNRLEVLAG